MGVLHADPWRCKFRGKRGVSSLTVTAVQTRFARSSVAGAIETPVADDSQGLVGKAPAGDAGFVHQAALGNGEGGHPALVSSDGGGIPLACAGTG